MSLPPSGVLPADQANGRCGEGGGGLTRCAVHLADPQLHGVHLHTRESHQEIPHHAHQEVSACFHCTFSFFCPSLSLSLHHLLFLPNSFISSIPLQFSLLLHLPLSFPNAAIFSLSLPYHRIVERFPDTEMAKYAIFCQTSLKRTKQRYMYIYLYMWAFSFRVN